MHKRKRSAAEPEDPHWRKGVFKDGPVYVHVNDDGNMVVNKDGLVTLRYSNKREARTYMTLPNKVRFESAASAAPPPPPKKARVEAKELVPWTDVLFKYQRTINVCFVARVQNALAVTIRFRCGDDFSDAKTLEESCILQDQQRLDPGGIASTLIGTVIKTYDRMGPIMDLDSLPSSKKATKDRSGHVDKKMSNGLLVIVLDDAALHSGLEKAFHDANGKLSGYDLVLCVCKSIGKEKVVDVANVLCRRALAPRGAF